MGITEKIPYLKELGINALELLPAYEFEECEPINTAETIAKTKTIEYQVQHIDEKLDLEDGDTSAEESGEVRLNYWGFKEAYYFAPKASYAAGENPCDEFKQWYENCTEMG